MIYTCTLYSWKRERERESIQSITGHKSIPQFSSQEDNNSMSAPSDPRRSESQVWNKRRDKSQNRVDQCTSCVSAWWLEIARSCPTYLPGTLVRVHACKSRVQVQGTVSVSRARRCPVINPRTHAHNSPLNRFVNDVRPLRLRTGLNKSFSIRLPVLSIPCYQPPRRKLMLHAYSTGGRIFRVFSSSFSFLLLPLVVSSPLEANRFLST